MFAWTRNRRNPNNNTRSASKQKLLRFLPQCEPLEDRATPTASSITSNFNGTAIPAGDTLWFSGSLTASGLPKNAPATIHVDNGVIDFTAGGSNYHISVPNGVIVLTPGATSSSTSFDPTDNDWDVSAPSGGTGDVFMGGVAVALPSGLPGGIRNVTWSANFWADTANISVNWKWAAAAYKTSVASDPNALSVKPVDNNSLSVYKNSDQAGAPEAIKSSLVSGGTGGGGTNYTGTPTKAIAVKVDLGDGLSDYPFASSNPLTSIAFNESAVLRGASLDVGDGTFKVWYNDEHALALGVNQVSVKTASGTTTTNYPIATMTSNPSSAINPLVGTTATSGDQAGTDVSGRPITPSLFITDITNDPTNRSGDWQYGGTGITPNAVFGTWKAFAKTVDYTTATPTVTLVTSVDPVKNNWNLGAGSDAPPVGYTNEGYGAEMRWNLADLQAKGILIPGHIYRFYVMVHDGDQNKSGGDAGQASFTYTYAGVSVASASISGQVFYDSNLDGTIDANDAPASGITISLFDSNGNVVAQTATDSSGNYSFSFLASGTYTVKVTSEVPEAAFAGNLGGSNSPDGGITGISVGDGGTATNYNFLLYTSLG